MREQAGLTTNALAESTPVDPKYLWKLERGIARNPGRNLLIDLARSLVGYTKLFNESNVDMVMAAANYPSAPLPDPNPSPNYLTRHLYR